MILDAGVFIALDNPSRARIILTLMQRLANDDEPLATTDAALAQAWRDPARQVLMAKLVGMCEVHAFGDPKTIGTRCATTGTSDVVDAGLAVLADQLGDVILTTDPADMAKLEARHVTLGNLT